MNTKVVILGGSGYTGQELARLVTGHPQLELSACMSARQDSPTPQQTETTSFPVTAFDPDVIAEADAVFVCTPHGTAAPLVAQALDHGAKVIDLSADFRLRNLSLYEATYNTQHPHPELIPQAVYGLTEHARDAVRSSQLVANPGCYPTAVLLALKPLIEKGLLRKNRPIIADCKSGTSGAGHKPQTRTHFGAVHDNFLAYGVGSHRHQPEIEQEASRGVVFVPHLLPVFRGILATIYVTPSPNIDAEEVHAVLAAQYEAEPFVRVLQRATPELRFVQHSNRCDLAVGTAGDQVVLLAAIDNLLKGAAGQALQNLNLMFDFPETQGLV